LQITHFENFALLVFVSILSHSFFHTHDTCLIVAENVDRLHRVSLYWAPKTACPVWPLSFL